MVFYNKRCFLLSLNAHQGKRYKDHHGWMEHLFLTDQHPLSSPDHQPLVAFPPKLLSCQRHPITITLTHALTHRESNYTIQNLESFGRAVAVPLFLWHCPAPPMCIQVLNTDLSYSHMFGSWGSGQGQFDCPYYVSCDNCDNVYTTYCGGKLRMVTGFLVLGLTNQIAGIM